MNDDSLVNLRLPSGSHTAELSIHCRRSMDGPKHQLSGLGCVAGRGNPRGDTTPENARWKLSPAQVILTT
jgi:hypothetical protein